MPLFYSISITLHMFLGLGDYYLLMSYIFFRSLWRIYCPVDSSINYSSFSLTFLFLFRKLAILLSDCCYSNSYDIVMEKQWGHVLIGMDFALLGIGGHQTMLSMLHLRCVLHFSFDMIFLICII